MCVLETQVHDPESLLATLVHELAHVLLLGGGLLTTDVPDHELVTDLLRVFLGLGPCLANAVLRENWARDGQMYWWGLQRQGYLTARYYGYAFALFAWRRGEDKPPWKQHLRPDVREPFEQSLAYLRKTGDSLFQRGEWAAAGKFSKMDELVRALHHESASVRLNALWSLPDFAALRRAIIDFRTERIEDLADAIIRVSEEPVRIVREHLGGDAELYRLALHAIKARQSPEEGSD